MASEDKQARLEFRRAALKSAYKAYLDIQSGQAQSYTVGSRTITKHNIEDLHRIINSMEKEIDALEAELNGRSRCAVAVVPMEW